MFLKLLVGLNAVLLLDKMIWATGEEGKLAYRPIGPTIFTARQHS